MLPECWEKRGPVLKSAPKSPKLGSRATEWGRELGEAHFTLLVSVFVADQVLSLLGCPHPLAFTQKVWVTAEVSSYLRDVEDGGFGPDNT